MAALGVSQEAGRDTRAYSRVVTLFLFRRGYSDRPRTYGSGEGKCVGRRILIVNQRLLPLHVDILWMIFRSTLLIKKMLIHYKESLLYSVYIPCAFITCRYDLSTGFFTPDFMLGSQRSLWASHSRHIFILHTHNHTYICAKRPWLFRAWSDIQRRYFRPLL